MLMLGMLCIFLLNALGILSAAEICVVSDICSYYPQTFNLQVNVHGTRKEAESKNMPVRFGQTIKVPARLMTLCRRKPSDCGNVNMSTLRVHAA